MTKIIVTGSHGFIGSNLMKRLPDARALDQSLIDYDFGIPECDKVFFLSTYGNMAHHNDCSKIIQANVTDVVNASCGFHGWFCYMSSSSVTLSVQTPYSRTKRAAEEILQALPEIKSCIVRPYSVTGVGEQKEHLIPTLIRSCMEGEEMPFDPLPVHDFVDVEDLVAVLIALSNDQSTGIHEIGHGIPYENRQVRWMVESACGREANVIPRGSLRSYDNREWFCKNPIKGAKSLEQSISEMVEAYKNEKRYSGS